MPGLNKYLPLLAVICLGIVFQLLLIPLDCRNKPYTAAVAFTQAYLKIDPSMADYLCEESLSVDDIDTVAQYIYLMAKQARDRGFDKSYLKAKLYHIKTDTTYLGDTEAVVNLSAERRTAINPVFAWVARLFHIGGTYTFHTSLEVIKEDGRWKVCGAPLSLIQDI